MSIIHVSTPATTANLGPGFDCMGLALQLHNRLTVTTPASGLEVTVSGEGAHQLPRDGSHMVVRAMRHLFQHIGRTLPPLRLHQENAIPLTHGLGSSAAAVVAGLLAANLMAGEPLSQDALVDMATMLEGHPDNVTACLTGGLAVTAQEGNRVHYVRVEPAGPLHVVLYIPTFEMSTSAARRRLPDLYSRADVVFSLSRAALGSVAFATGRWDLLRVSMQDSLHQCYRADAYPQMPALLDAALQAGARGAALSGSGPTIAAFTDADPEPVMRALETTGAAGGLAGRTLCVPVDLAGARAEREE